MRVFVAAVTLLALCSCAPPGGPSALTTVAPGPSAGAVDFCYQQMLASSSSRR